MEVDTNLLSQVLVERSGNYELVDARHLLTPEPVRTLTIYYKCLHFYIFVLISFCLVFVFLV